jgi:hypothetical protein
MKTRTVSRKSAYVLVFAILITASFLAGSAANKGQLVNAQGADIAAAPAATDDSRVCTIGFVADYGARMQVWCSNGPGPIFHFAAPLTSATESRHANRFLAMLISAYALNRQVLVYYEPSATLNPPGCSAADCRLLTGVVLQ